MLNCIRIIFYDDFLKSDAKIHIKRAKSKDFGIELGFTRFFSAISVILAGIRQKKDATLIGHVHVNQSELINLYLYCKRCLDHFVEIKRWQYKSIQRCIQSFRMQHTSQRSIAQRGKLYQQSWSKYILILLTDIFY